MSSVLKNENTYETLCNDLLNFRTQFESLTSSPQTITDVSSVVAKIILARGLNSRAKNNTKIIKSEPTISEVKKIKLMSKYNDFGRDVYNYEKETYQKWLQEANNFEESFLRNKNDLMFFDNNKLVSRFDKELVCFMNTVRHLLLLQFDLPKDLMVLVERKFDIYYNKFQIDKLVGLYNEFEDKISKDAPVLLVMKKWCKQIMSHLQPGLEKKNSLVTLQLPQCIENSFHCLKQINTILSIIKSYEKDITENLELIENLTFLPMDFYEENNILDFSKTFDKFKARRNGNTVVITGAMTYIAQGLNLIEHTCFGTATGCHKSMHLYYEKYENALFDAFIRMVINNLNTLKKLLDEDRVAFVVRGKLIYTHFVFDPDLSTIINSVAAAIDDIPNQLKSVPRWLRTTNFRCSAIQNLETMEISLPYSFYDLVIEKLSVQESRDACFRSLEKFRNILENQSEKFKKFRFLREKQDELKIRRFNESNPTLDDYNEKLGFIISLPKKVEELKYIDLGCVRLDNTELIDNFTEQCQLWISTYGNNLISQCKNIIITFSERIVALEEQLGIRIRNDQDISVVCEVIDIIKKTNIDADITFQNIHDRFHVLVKHNIIIPKEQFSTFKKLKMNWQSLYVEALGKNFCIEDAKNRFLKSNKN